MEKQLKRRKILTCFGLMVCTLLLSLTTYAQSRHITGKIIAADDNQPVAGVNVYIRGTTTAATSTLTGDYAIEAKTGDVLVFKFIGFIPKEITVAQNNAINVTLTTESKILNEVVVIGYGTAKRPDLTGSISSISAPDIL
jgi:hypothetical protein